MVVTDLLRIAFTLAGLHGPADPRTIERLTSDEGQPREVEMARICRAIHTHATRAGIDELLLLAMAWEESRLDPARVNASSGALGLFQVMRTSLPKRCANWSDATVMAIDTNTWLAVEDLRAKLKAAGGDVRVAVQRFGGRGKRARAYADRVMRLYEKLKRWRTET